MNMEVNDEGGMYSMDVTPEEQSEMVCTNDSNDSVDCQESYNVDESQEIEKPIYMLNNIDTEVSIKTEIKQLILNNISEEISSNDLNCMTYEAAEQFLTLQEKAGSLDKKIQELNKEVKTDGDQLEQTHGILMKTDEMISLLKEKIETLMTRYRESRMKELSEKSVQQLEKLHLIKTYYQEQIKKETDSLKNIETVGTERNTFLKAELSQKDEFVNILRKKLDEFKKLTSYDDEIEKYLAKKQALELKLKSVTDRRVAQEKDKNVFSNLSSKNVDFDKLSKLTEKKNATSEQLEKAVRELQEAETTLAENNNRILQKEMKLKELKNKLKDTKETRQESFNKFQRNYDNACDQLKKISATIAICNAKNDQLLLNLNTLNAEYEQKCEEKLTTMNKHFEKQADMQRNKMYILKKQTENEIEQNKYEDLKKQYEKFLELLHFLENNFIKERENSTNELKQLQLKFETASADHNKYLLEMKEKKEYLLSTSKFLEKKSESRKHDRVELENLLKNAEEENMSLKSLTEKRVHQLDERKKTLNSLKNVQSDVPLESGIEAPNGANRAKKVRFNEILSIKSVTSSECSVLRPIEDASLETSMQGDDQSEEDKSEEES